MSSHVSPIREPLVQGHKTYHDITEDLVSPTERAPGAAWITGFALSVSMLGFGLFCIAWTIWHGIGTWNLNRTVGWGWDITNFVWWIGIGHAGTLISAILLLFRQKWRTGVNRAAEAMTIFAVICAALFPGIHVGRAWVVFYFFPYPNTRGPLWPNFNSPLLWDLFAISTYFTVSLLFWYTGLVPDFATVRDRAKGFRRKVYNFLSFGWTGSAKHWQRWESLSLILAGIATPLVLSVHTIVSFDFATSVIPGWHTTIFPPYFVAGAIFSGFAMVLTLMIVTRKLLKLEEYITIAHIESMNKVILVTGTIVGVAYLTELFIAWYSGYVYEQFAFFNRAAGPYWWSYFGMMFCNVVSPQIFWKRSFRRNIAITFFVSIVINIGMWFERFVIIATTLARDYLPSSWSYYTPTWVEIGIFIGTLGLFFTLYLLFTRVAPVVAIAEVKSILKTAGDQYTGPNAIHNHSDHTSGAETDSEAGFDTIVETSASAISMTSGMADSATSNVEESQEPNEDSDVVTTDAGVKVRSTTGVDDLKKIEGIGPKVSDILNEGNIYTFSELADVEVPYLRQLLDAAGPSYKSHNPESWPEQAALARDGKWAELKDLQDRLDGGKYV
ncbi:MAG: polysulfide reductase NrfD [Saprospiraceae bacterium]|nr:polysulfide reductase NrfD [Bacteroidia bacterium]NNE13878.1 polysulfide reductase NrfD [Saprospiraceae bacterium]